MLFAQRCFLAFAAFRGRSGKHEELQNYSSFHVNIRGKRMIDRVGHATDQVCVRAIFFADRWVLVFVAHLERYGLGELQVHEYLHNENNTEGDKHEFI